MVFLILIKGDLPIANCLLSIAQPMSKNKRLWIILVVLAIGIKIFSLFPDAVETYYSDGIYPVISSVQRILLGWIPFSIGDFFYALVVLYIIRRLVIMIRLLFKKKTNKEYWLGGLRRIGFIALLVYVSFNLLWGLNYNRIGIAKQVGLVQEKIDKEVLVAMMRELVKQVNGLDSLAHLNREKFKSKRYLFQQADQAYENLHATTPIFKYNFRSVKPSLFSYLGNYLGYTGYYNPFSGEAQVNTTVPLFVQPFTACHEIGHQLGYAKENEANFAGFLSAKSSDDPAVRYSVYFDLYSYARFYLYVQDSMQLKRLDSTLHPGVRKDFRDLREFIRKHENPIENVIDKMYSQYLKANEQPSGKVTYGEVIIWLAAYYRKHQEI